MDKAILKQNKYLKQAEILKEKRDKRALKLKPIWDKQKLKKEQKLMNKNKYK